MADAVDVVVIGAGVVGLAVARHLAVDGLDVLVLENEDAVGTQTSSRNSEVIHAGIYYPIGSRKATACVAGRELLYRYCAEHDVPHRRLGKLIVATTPAQMPDLDRILSRAQANGVDDLVRVDRSEMVDLEPHLSGVAGLLSPSTGIVDSHALMRSLRRDAESAGAVVALRSRMVAGVVRPGSPKSIDVDGVGSVTCRMVVNCAGLGAWDVARSLDGFPGDRIPPSSIGEGELLAPATGRTPFRRLIYPVPVDGGLGVHLTLDMAGGARFGPDVEWCDSVDYGVDPRRADRFYAEIRQYWPELPDGSLQPAYAGIRPKLTGPGTPAADFLVQGPADHGVPGLVNLFGIESPGLTSCLALARDVAEVLGNRSDPGH